MIAVATKGSTGKREAVHGGTELRSDQVIPMDEGDFTDF